MKFYEIMLVGGLVLLIGGVFWAVYRSPDKTLFWMPLTMFAAVFSYYFVIGPLLALGFGSTNFYGMDLRSVMWKPWLAGLIGLASIYAGFALRTVRVRLRLTPRLAGQQQSRVRWACGILLALGMVGFAYVAYTSGRSPLEMLMPVHSNGADVSAIEREGFAAGNYVFLLINLFIPGLCLLAAVTGGQPWRRRLFLLGVPVCIVLLLYTTISFRHRIVTLLVSLAATLYLSRKKRPSPVALLAGTAGIVLLAGFIVLSRSYGQGLDLSQIKDLSLLEIFIGGFNDAGTFFTTALIMDSFPSTFPFLGLNPVWIALTLPIPRAIWPDKPYPEFLTQFQYLMGTQGQSTPVTGEHYMMAGWIGIVIGGLIIGLLYRGFWEFYRANPRNPLVIAMYAVSWALIFPLVNRGYLAQTVMEFSFDLLPLVVLFLICRKAMLATPARRKQRVSVSSEITVPLLPTQN